MTELKSRIVTKKKPNEIGAKIEHSDGKYLPDTGQYPRSIMRIVFVLLLFVLLILLIPVLLLEHAVA
jgi:hypothetical protein